MADRGFRGRPTRSERADRRINEGHSRGLDKALAKTEASIRNDLTESIYAFDRNGKLISSNSAGTSHNVAVPRGHNYKDAVFTHNHPGSGLGNNIAGRIGRSFSGADLAVAITHDAAEMRAVTNNYTYSIKRPKNGWGVSSPQEAVNIANRIKRMHHGAYNREYSRIMPKLNRGEITREYANQALDRADVASINGILRGVAKKYGWSYTRKKTS